MKTKLLTVTLILSVLLVLAWMPFTENSAYAKTYRLRIGAGHPEAAAIWVKRLREFFAAEITKRTEASTDHEIDWVYGFGGSVAKIGEVLEAVQDGILDVGLVAYVSNRRSSSCTIGQCMCPLEAPTRIRSPELGWQCMIRSLS